MSAARSLPPFPALRAFRAAAKHGRLRAAAAELGITESAVSHQIRKLEDFLHVQLFDRTGPALQLTDAGRKYFTGVDRAIALLQESTDAILGADDRARVVLTLPSSLVTHWLIPRLPGFEAACPGIDLQLVATGRLCDLAREQIDLAIRYGTPPWRDVESEPFLSEFAMPVCAPGFLDADQAADMPRALEEVRLLVNESHPEEWAEWTHARGLPAPAMTNVMSLAASDQVLEAATRGLGLAIGRSPAVDDRLAAGELVIPFSGHDAAVAHYHLCRPTGVEPTAPVRKVAAWLRGIAADTRPLDGAGTPDAAPRARPAATGPTP